MQGRISKVFLSVRADIQTQPIDITFFLYR